jgi:hypothetical protein
MEFRSDSKLIVSLVPQRPLIASPKAIVNRPHHPRPKFAGNQCRVRESPWVPPNIPMFFAVLNRLHRHNVTSL